MAALTLVVSIALIQKTTCSLRGIPGPSRSRASSSIRPASRVRDVAVWLIDAMSPRAFAGSAMSFPWIRPANRERACRPFAWRREPISRASSR